jgi:hypothetical protein
LRDGRQQCIETVITREQRWKQDAGVSNISHLYDYNGKKHTDEQNQRLKLVEIEVKRLPQTPSQHHAERDHQDTNLGAAACKQHTAPGDLTYQTTEKQCHSYNSMPEPQLTLINRLLHHCAIVTNIQNTTML